MHKYMKIHNSHLEAVLLSGVTFRQSNEYFKKFPRLINFFLFFVDTIFLNIWMFGHKKVPRYCFRKSEYLGQHSRKWNSDSMEFKLHIANSIFSIYSMIPA